MDFLKIYLLIGAFFAVMELYVANKTLDKFDKGEEFDFPEEEEYAIALEDSRQEMGNNLVALTIIVMSLFLWPITVYAFFSGFFAGEDDETD